MQYGLKPSTIEAIQQVFAKHQRIEKAVVYGSRAKGNYRPGSDIDLTLVAPAMDLTALLKIENELDDLLLPYKIDLSLFHQINDEELRSHIQRAGADFYINSTTQPDTLNSTHR